MSLVLLQNLRDPQLVDRLLSRTPLGRLAQPEDVSGEISKAYWCSVAVPLLLEEDGNSSGSGKGHA